LRKNTKYYRLNYQINAPKIRLLDETGKQLGVVERNSALKQAQAEGKDLVEIAPNANPPVVKLIDFKKFKYLEAKKERQSKKTVKNVGIKEIRLSPFISEHDFKIRITKGEDFLKTGNQLKISIPFHGREITHKEFGMEVANKALTYLQTVGKVIKSPHFEGKVLVSILSPAKINTAKKQDVQTKNQEITNQKV